MVNRLKVKNSGQNTEMWRRVDGNSGEEGAIDDYSERI
jgi:hypothetical protein